jgi:hypothetical protein
VRVFRVVGLIGLALALSACVHNQQNLNTTFLDRYAEPDPTPARFSECRGFGCAEKANVSLNKRAWRSVHAVFRPRAKNAKAERRQIAKAVARVRMLVGAQTGTAVHQWTHKDMRVLPNRGDPTQLDCIDESVNTWTYLTMMERDKMFRFHSVAKLSAAGTPVEPRNTAVIQEKRGDYYAIDSSLVDAGEPPLVMPLATWLGDWPPELPAGTARADAGSRPRG